MSKRIVTLSLISVVALVLSTAPWALALERLKFGTPVKVSANYALPPMAAEEKGFWKENGLEGEWIPFKGGAEMNRALAAGAVDVAFSAAALAIRGISAGVPNLIVANTGSRVSFVVWVKADGPLKAPRDLKGAKIASGRTGELTHGYGLAVAKALGLEKDIRFLSGGGITEELALIKGGQIDGRVGDLLSGLPLMVKGELRVLVKVDDYLPEPWLDQVVVAQTSFSKRNPELVKKALRALRQSAEFVGKNRTWSEEKMQTELAYPPEAAKLGYDSFGYARDWKIAKKAVENVITFLTEYGIVARDKAPAVEQVYNESFLE